MFAAAQTQNEVAVTLTGFRIDRVTYAQHPDVFIRPPSATLVGIHTKQLPS